MSIHTAPTSVTAPRVDTSHLTGISYAAVQTTVQTTIEGNLIGLACDGNGRSTSVVGIDANLSLVGRHAQVLAAHYPDQGIRDFLPGYMDPGKCGDRRNATTLVWVLS
jgi:hypothetical protein